jgi:hypothetical protein
MKAVANEIGWTPGTPMTPDQAIQLSMAGRRVTTDFAAAGDISRVLNAAVPFYNPAVQGLRTFGRTFRNHPARSTLLGLGALTVPTLLNWWRNKDKEWYQALPWREKYLYDNVDDGVNVWQIPRPFEWGNLFQVMPEALFDSWYRQDPEGVKQALWHVFETTNPADYPVLAKMAKEQWQNRIEFWDRPIVPRSEIDLPASQQVGPYTTRLAKAMGRAFPSVSPRRIDAAVRGYFGSAVPDMLDFIGLGASAQERERELSDLPVFGKLIRRGGQFNAQNQQIADFFDQYLTLRAKVNGARKQMAAEAQGKPTGPPIALDAMDTGKLKDAEKRAEAIRALTDMATTTKERKAREELYREAGQLAAEGVDVMKLKEQP